MKQKTTLFKTILLVAAMMLGNSQAWAGDVVYQRGGTYTAWSSNDYSEGQWTSTENASLSISAEKGLLCTITNNSGGSVSLGIAPTANSILTIDAVWEYNGGNTANNTGFFKIGDAIAFNAYTKGNSRKIECMGVDAISIGGGRFSDTWTIHVVVNTSNHKITEMTVTSTGGANYSLGEGNTLQIVGTPSYSTLTMGMNNRNETNVALHSISITEVKQDVSTYGYTVNYKEGNNVVKTVTGSLAEGAAIPVLTALDGEGTYEGNHYLISAAEAPSWTISSTEAENEHDVAVRVPYSTAVNVYYVVDGVKDAEPSSTLNYTETDAKVANWYYYFPYYITRDSKWYKATLKNTTDFGETGTFNTTGGTLNKEVEYTLDTDVAYFGESQWTGTTGITYSNGERSNRTGSQSYTYNNIPLSAGTYEMIVPGTSYGDCTVKMGETTVGTIPMGGGSFVFEKADDENVSFKFSGNMRQLDYFLIKKNPKVSATIGSTGWATLYTPYALNFDGTGLTAYTATCTSSIVTLTPVTNVPANTGVVLKGAAKDYDIPVINSSSTDKGHMVGSTTAATAYNTYDGYDLYMLVKNASNEAQFKKVTSGSIAAGKAFLKINSGASSLAPVMDVVFADGTTGIDSVQDSGLKVNGYYDLQGRKVANPTKGLYIVNGKKVIIK